MKHIFKVLAACGFISLNANAEPVVVGHKSLQVSLSAAEVKNLFLSKRNALSSGQEIEIVEQGTDSPLRADFHNKYTNKTQAQLQSYRARLVFTGKGEVPKEVSNSEELISMISGDSRLIGYIDSSEITDGVAVLFK